MENEVLKRGRIQLTSFTKLDQSSLLEVLSWRNHEAIRKQMNTTEIISDQNHFTFCESLKGKEDVIYWLVERKGRRCGVVNLRSMSDRFTEAEWGYYAAPAFLGTGIGLEMAFECIQMFFEEMGVKRLHGYIKETNQENLRMQKSIGFKTNGTTKRGDVTIVNTVITEKLPEEDFKFFQKRLLYGR
jgi:UDP-4-amino-4,6-dideoxy-N-acetyl-beta-L-altrosamine N-acetyltransferase